MKPKKKIPLTRRHPFASHTLSTADTIIRSDPQSPGKFPSKQISHNQIISRVHAANKKGMILSPDIIDVYQSASLYGNKHFDSSKWLIKHIDSTQVRHEDVRLLDVGALRPVYSIYPWIKADYIDLHPNHPAVRQADFLQCPPTQYHIVCLSLVINFTGDPVKRYAMMEKARGMVESTGLVFIVLPCAVILNSRRMTEDYFLRLLKKIGFAVVKMQYTRKLALFLLKPVLSCNDALPRAPNLYQSGANNFRIVPP